MSTNPFEIIMEGRMRWWRWKFLREQISIYNRAITNQHQMALEARIGRLPLYLLNPNLTPDDCLMLQRQQEQHGRDMAHIARENIEKMTAARNALQDELDSLDP